MHIVSATQEAKAGRSPEPQSLKHLGYRMWSWLKKVCVAGGEKNKELIYSSSTELTYTCVTDIKDAIFSFIEWYTPFRYWKTQLAKEEVAVDSYLNSPVYVMKHENLNTYLNTLKSID